MSAYNTALTRTILELHQLNARLQKRDDITVSDLQDAAAKASEVLTTLQAVAEERMRPELRAFMLAVIHSVNRLRVMVEKKLPVPVSPNELLEDVNENFGRFVDRNVTPSNYETIRETITYAPYVGATITLMYTLPSRWNSATEMQKLALTLGALIVLTCLALTIAVWTAPGLATVPCIGTVITCTSACAAWLYKNTIRKIDERRKEEPILKKTLGALKTQQESLRVLLKKCSAANNPAPEKLAEVVKKRSAPLRWGKTAAKSEKRIALSGRGLHRGKR